MLCSHLWYQSRNWVGQMLICHEGCNCVLRPGFLIWLALIKLHIKILPILLDYVKQ